MLEVLCDATGIGAGGTWSFGICARCGNRRIKPDRRRSCAPICKRWRVAGLRGVTIRNPVARKVTSLTVACSAAFQITFKPVFQLHASISPASAWPTLLIAPLMVDLRMILAPCATHWSRCVLARVLVLALLCAQWSGLQHRIQHGFGQSPTVISASQAMSGVARNGPFADVGALHHSCLQFDAAALAVTIHSALFAGLALPSDYIRTPSFANTSWHAPFSCHFLSRAPPVA